jgi:hypothetical protein
MSVVQVHLVHAAEEQRRRERQRKTSFWVVVAIALGAAAILRYPEASRPVSEGSLLPSPGEQGAWSLVVPAGTPPRCNTQTFSGGDNAETHVIEMGKSVGTFSFSYDTYDIPDLVTVTYEGRPLLDDSGCFGRSNTKTLAYSGTSSHVTVEVIPNCSGGTKGTRWTFTVACPK